MRPLLSNKKEVEVTNNQKSANEEKEGQQRLKIVRATKGRKNMDHPQLRLSFLPQFV